MMHSTNGHLNTIHVLQFLSFEDLGHWQTWLQQENYHIQVYQAGVDDLSVALQQAQPLVILGGPIGVYETENYPFLAPLLAQLKIRLEQNLPTLGICLGAQLIASALGANVYAGHIKEIGWSKVYLSDQATSSPLQHLQEINVLHWHGDTFDLPPQATLLASTAHYPHQAFTVGRNVLALQFHVELNPTEFERWLVGHSHELQHAKIDILALREQNREFGHGLMQKSHLVLKQWLDYLV